MMMSVVILIRVQNRCLKQMKIKILQKQSCYSKTKFSNSRKFYVFWELSCALKNIIDEKVLKEV